MSGPSAWRGSSSDRWGRSSGSHMPILANEVATFHRAPAIYAFLGGLAKLLAMAGFVMFVAILFRQHP